MRGFSRRSFLSSSVVAGVSGLALGPIGFLENAYGAAATARVNHEVTRDVPTRRFDGRYCLFHPRVAVVPGVGAGGGPRVIMTLNEADTKDSDVYTAMYMLYTDDLGRTWTEPKVVPGLGARTETRTVDGKPVDGEEQLAAPCDFWPGWHAASQTLLGTGQNAVYTPDWKPTKPKHRRSRSVVYATYDAAKNVWNPWQRMEMPAGDKFHHVGAGCTQRVDLKDGTILLPLYYRPQWRQDSSMCWTTIARCQFDGKTLRLLEHGDELSPDLQTGQGLWEPSLTKFDGTFYLTLRNLDRGYVTRSRDGLHFEKVQEWKFDDGQELGNYNTQQHWVTHSNGLFLVYTRRGANNDHVIRHRAPLFMAQVDPERLCVLRETEEVLIPERGGMLGNFGVTTISPEETWVTDAEGMWGYKKGEKYGRDGSVHVARIHWKQPNRAAS